MFQKSSSDSNLVMSRFISARGTRLIGRKHESLISRINNGERFACSVLGEILRIEIVFVNKFVPKHASIMFGVQIHWFSHPVIVMHLVIALNLVWNS